MIDDFMSDIYQKAYIQCDNNIVTSVSRSLLELCGYSKEELLYKKSSDVLQKLFGIDLSEQDTLENVRCLLFGKNDIIEDIFLQVRRYTDFDRKIFIIEPDSQNSEESSSFSILKQQARTMLKRNQQHEAVFENIAEFLIIFDRNGNFIKMNETARHFFSVNGQITNFRDAYAKTEYLDMDRNPIPIFRMPAYRILQGESIRQMRVIIRTGGRELYSEMSGRAICNESGEIEIGILCSRDVTSKVIYEDLLLNQFEHIYKIIDILDLPIARLTYPGFRVIRYNKKAVEILSEIMGRKITEDEAIVYNEKDYEKYIDNAGLLMECIKKIGTVKNTVHLDKLGIHKGDKTSYYNVIFQPVFNSTNSITDILVIGIDITHEVEKAEDIKNKLEMKDDFISFISHEFKTPLTVIYSAVQALESIYRNELSEKVKGFIKKIKQNSYRQLRLVNYLLDLTRADAGLIKMHKTNIDIVFLTHSIIDSVSVYAQQKGVGLVFTTELMQKITGIDEEKFERILLNLLSNAIKFTPKGKSIFVNVFDTEDMIGVSIRDEGIGIPCEKQDLIFSRYGQVDSVLSRQAEGAGIGLSLARMFVKALGGEIRLESEVGRGSTFTVLLPAILAQEPDCEKGHDLSGDSRLIQSVAIEFSDIYM